LDIEHVKCQNKNAPTIIGTSPKIGFVSALVFLDTIPYIQNLSDNSRME
jgi:hypothetical protein